VPPIFLATRRDGLHTKVSLVIAAVIGTGVLGSVTARLLASGGETLRLSSADEDSARTLAAEVGPAAVVAVDNRDPLGTYWGHIRDPALRARRKKSSI
jgi:threonine dehydrogenase-like Zn-dependent dehydrogenase